jgi:hypothetical protein
MAQINLLSTTGDSFNLIVYLEKDYDDIGYYIVSDGEIFQEKNKCNFTYKVFGKTISVFNSVDKGDFIELKNVSYRINWGDGTSESLAIEQNAFHTYISTGATQITLKLETPWSDSITKTVNVGGNAVISNPLGTLGIKIPYTDLTFQQNFLSIEDATCNQLEQSDVLVSGFTTSRLSELIKYGEKVPSEGLNSDGDGVLAGGITDSYTAYTMDEVFYTDFPDGLTYFHVNVGENPLELLCQLVTKDDALLGVVNDINVQTDVFVERGTISVFEQNLRLCDIDSVGEMEVYGNKYFNVKKTT